MTLDEFVKAFAAEFDDTPEESFKADTNYKELDEWGSLVALSIISMVDDDKVDTILDKLHAMDLATEKLGLRAFTWNIEKSI